MTARGVGKKKPAATPGKRGGRRVVPRSSLARRPRRGGASVGRYANPAAVRFIAPAAASPPPEKVPRKKGAAAAAPPAPPPPQKPRPVRPALRALMAGEWPQEPRPFTKAERAAAQKAVDFFETQLRHFEGKHAGKPFLLEIWQEAIVRRMFGRLNPDGTRQYREAYIELGRKNGKMLADETPVPTPGGWKRHGDLVVGDMVFAPDGRMVPVEAVTGSYQGPGYEVKLSDGTSIIAHANHEWMTKRKWFTKRRRGPNPGPLPPVETHELLATLRMSGRGDLVHRIPVAAPLQAENADLPIDPYVLGVWLGDGHTACARLTCFDAGIVDELQRRGCSVDSSSTRGLYLMGRGHLHVALRKLGVLGCKRIPPQYLRASERQRMDLLRGLMDTDGYASKRGQCEFVQVKRGITDDVIELIRSLGFKPSLKIARATVNGKDCGPSFRVQFWAWSDRPVFSLARKAARLRPPPTKRARSSSRMICGVVPVGQITGQCIQVEGGMYLAGDGMVPTHNSTIASGIALYLLAEDGEPGAQVFSCAGDRAQARICLRTASQMVLHSPALLQKLCPPFKNEIITLDEQSFYRVLSADADSQHGLNVHGVVLDETHNQPNRDLYDVMKTGCASRSQPMIVSISTAGFDRHSICWELHEYARKVIEGVITDPTFLAILYSADVGDDWTLPATWKKANPNLGVSISLEYLTAECEKAKLSSAYENTFRRLHLSQWTTQENRFIPMARWDECARPVDEPQLRGQICYAGLDLSSAVDVTAFVMVFPDPTTGDFVVHPHFFLPSDGIGERSQREGVPYDEWAAEGYLTLTPGEVIDYSVVRSTIVEASKLYKLKEVAFDRWGAGQISQEIDAMGIAILPFGQGFGSMSNPTKALLEKVIGKRIRHGGNPVLRWMAECTNVAQDPAGNIKPVKPDRRKNASRIDGIVAMIMALDRAMRHVASLVGGPKGRSVYADRGIRTI